MPSWKHSLQADNQVYLLARISDTVVAASLQAEAHILQEITLESYFGSDNLTLSADRIPSMTQTAAAVLALLPTAHGARTGSHVQGMDLEEVWGTFTLLHAACPRLLAKGAVIPLATTCLSSLKQNLEVKTD